eukprot:TRINITY_DN25741_c0_g1_i1.p1 TRINITY_DN25741_c0_g1~~TRINITY_DN25741_c0_g1_i1.p1  ORF type:complete len:234 (-),score=33.43 TRINITY_DN25741_c0_g1_i1:86-787(-)
MASGNKLSIFESLTASGTAVVGATMVTHPIDVVKVRLQLSQKGSAKADSFSVTRFLGFWGTLYRQEGLGAFSSGVRAAAARAGSYGAARIGLCEPLQVQTGSSTVGALAAGVLATCVGNPFEVLKVRLQARPADAEKGEIRALVNMVKQEGISILARGFLWAATRAALLTASQVVPYGEAKQILKSRAGLSESAGLHLLASLAAGVAKLASWACSKQKVHLCFSRAGLQTTFG